MDALGKSPSSKPNKNSPQAVAFHPLADIFPLMEGEEFDALVDDIKKTDRLHDEIVLYEGKILDGRNRYRACLAAGWPLDRIEGHCYRYEALGYKLSPLAYVCAKNLLRRHLTAEQKRDVIAALIRTDPTKSNLAISKMAKSSHHTVEAVREKMEAAGDVGSLPTRTDSKGREQPAYKPRIEPDLDEGWRNFQKREAAVRKAAAEVREQRAANADDAPQRRTPAESELVAALRIVLRFARTKPAPNIEGALRTKDLDAIERLISKLNVEHPQQFSGVYVVKEGRISFTAEPAYVRCEFGWDEMPVVGYFLKRGPEDYVVLSAGSKRYRNMRDAMDEVVGDIDPKTTLEVEA
jgi:hypothetical protein